MMGILRQLGLSFRGIQSLQPRMENQLFACLLPEFPGPIRHLPQLQFLQSTPNSRSRLYGVRVALPLSPCISLARRRLFPWPTLKPRLVSPIPPGRSKSSPFIIRSPCQAAALYTAPTLPQTMPFQHIQLQLHCPKYLNVPFTLRLSMRMDFSNLKHTIRTRTHRLLYITLFRAQNMHLITASGRDQRLLSLRDKTFRILSQHHRSQRHKLARLHMSLVARFIISTPHKCIQDQRLAGAPRVELPTWEGL
jgi:hypothetical protein